MVVMVSLPSDDKSVVAVRMGFILSLSVLSKLISEESNGVCSSRVF
jgi:hypothetical protein